MAAVPEGEELGAAATEGDAEDENTELKITSLAPNGRFRKDLFKAGREGSGAPGQNVCWCRCFLQRPPPGHSAPGRLWPRLNFQTFSFRFSRLKMVNYISQHPPTEPKNTLKVDFVADIFTDDHEINLALLFTFSH